MLGARRLQVDRFCGQICVNANCGWIPMPHLLNRRRLIADVLSAKLQHMHDVNRSAGELPPCKLTLAAVVAAFLWCRLVLRHETLTAIAARHDFHNRRLTGP